jgi:hypothetical protein
LIEINFKCNFKESLSSLFESGIESYSVVKPTNGRPDCIYLRIKDGRTLRLSSYINELDNWDEIGSLKLDVLQTTVSQINFKKLTLKWCSMKRASRLVIHDETIKADCGLKFINELDHFLIILPSSFPNRVEIKSTFYDGDFDPECDLVQYSEVKL